jgi:hypothetical protein
VIALFSSARIANEPPFVAATAWSPEPNLSHHQTSTEGLRRCFEECRGLCRPDVSAVPLAIRSSRLLHFFPAVDLPRWRTVLREHQ